MSWTYAPGRMARIGHLTTAEHHWHPSDVDLSKVHEEVTDGSVVHVVKTACLLESRSDQYADYLHAVLRERGADWRSAIERWRHEEGQHGVALRMLCEARGTDFRFHDLMTAYRDRVAYHPSTGQSVRGSIAAEMVARCVVEALASTLYRALESASPDGAYRTTFAALARDEARHHAMFRSMLRAEESAHGSLGFFRKVGITVRRMLELEDEQIMVASALVAGRCRSADLRAEAHFHTWQLYRHYRLRHLTFAARLVWKTWTDRTSKLAVLCLSLALHLALKVRWGWAWAHVGRAAEAREQTG